LCASSFTCLPLRSPPSRAASFQQKKTSSRENTKYKIQHHQQKVQAKAKYTTTTSAAKEVTNKKCDQKKVKESKLTRSRCFLSSRLVYFWQIVLNTLMHGAA